MSPYATEGEYALAIQRGQKLYDQQKREIWFDAGATVDFQVNYKVESGRVDPRKPPVYEPVLQAENVNVGELVWVDVTSRRMGVDATSITRMHAKSGCFIVGLIKKEYDCNLPEKQLRPSELLWQSFA